MRLLGRLDMVFVNIEIIFFRIIYDNMKKLIRIHSLKKEDELKLKKRIF